MLPFKRGLGVTVLLWHLGAPGGVRAASPPPCLQVQADDPVLQEEIIRAARPQFHGAVSAACDRPAPPPGGELLRLTVRQVGDGWSVTLSRSDNRSARTLLTPSQRPGRFDLAEAVAITLPDLQQHLAQSPPRARPARPPAPVSPEDARPDAPEPPRRFRVPPGALGLAGGGSALLLTGIGLAAAGAAAPRFPEESEQRGRRLSSAALPVSLVGVFTITAGGVWTLLDYLHQRHQVTTAHAGKPPASL